MAEILLARRGAIARTVNVWRIGIVALSFFLLIAARAAGATWISPLAIGVVSIWVLLSLCWGLMLRQSRSRRSIDRINLLVPFVDLTLGLGAHFLVAGAWWVGTSFALLIVAGAAINLRLRHILLISGYGSVLFLAMVMGEASGVLSAPKPGSIPSLEGDFLLASVVASVAAISLFSAVALMYAFKAQIRASRSKYQLLVEQSPFIIASFTQDGEIVMANPAAMSMFGDQLGDRGLVAVPEEHRAEVVRAIEIAFGGRRQTLDYPYKRRGELCWLRVTFLPAADVDQRRIIMMGVDITQEKAQQTEQQRLRDELAATARVRLVGQLVSGVAHELNNPLTSILGFAGQLQQTASTEEQNQSLKIIEQQASRARHIVRDLLQVVRAPQQRSLSVNLLEEPVRRALEGVKDFAAQANVTIRFQVVGNLQPVALDLHGIEQVVTNIVTNGITVTPGGNISVTVAGSDSEHSIVVEDDGHGIAEAILPRLFEPFFTTRPNDGGTGLGLAVSRGIVEQHGGTLIAENRLAPATGAKFTITLPVVAEGNLPIGPDQQADLPETDRTFSAVVVDDEPTIALLVQSTLENNGWEVQAFSSTREADLALFENRPPDVVLSDMRMPGEDGPAFYARVTATKPELASRFVFITGDTVNPKVANFLTSCACAVVEKPFTPEDLIRTARAVALAGTAT